MVMLNFTPRSFAQKLRMVLRSAPHDAVLVVSESHHDSRTIAKLLADNAVPQPGSGKGNCVGAYDYLSPSEHERVLFLVDCDGDCDPALLARRNMIVSENRDLESDLFISLNAFSDIVVQHLAGRGDASLAESRALAKNYASFAVSVATALGVVRDRAAMIRLKTNFAEGDSRPRKYMVRDLPGLSEKCAALEQISESDVIDGMRVRLSWSDQDVAALRRQLALGARKLCRAHAVADCAACKARRYANGHDLMDLGARILCYRINREAPSAKANHKFFEELIRSCVTSGQGASWSFVQRTHRFETWSGLRVLA